MLAAKRGFRAAKIINICQILESISLAHIASAIKMILLTPRSLRTVIHALAAASNGRFRAAPVLHRDGGRRHRLRLRHGSLEGLQPLPLRSRQQLLQLGRIKQHPTGNSQGPPPETTAETDKRIQKGQSLSDNTKAQPWKVWFDGCHHFTKIPKFHHVQTMGFPPNPANTSVGKTSRRISAPHGHCPRPSFHSFWRV